MIKELSARQKAAALTHAIECLKFAHGGMTGEDHTSDVMLCDAGCAHKQSIIALRQIRKDVYAAIQKTRTK